VTRINTCLCDVCGNNITLGTERWEQRPSPIKIDVKRDGINGSPILKEDVCSSCRNIFLDNIKLYFEYITAKSKGEKPEFLS
jgi:hypothetical protein